MTDRDEFDRDEDLRARLRAIDPAASLPPATPEASARLLEDIMSDDIETPTPQTGTRGRNPLTWLVAAAAVAVIGGVGIYAVTGGDEDENPPTASDTAQTTAPSAPTSSEAATVPGGTVTELEAAAGAGRCVVPDAAMLAEQTLAFAGTVESVEGDVVTLVPSEFYTGEETDLVEVTAPAPVLGSLEFTVGGDYLVSATDGQVTLCGFSGPVGADIENLYADAFGS